MIEVKNLSKHYGEKRAVDNISFSVKEGEILGFLGPNGAGKSTALRIILGMLRKNGGDIQLLGQDPWHDAVKLHGGDIAVEKCAEGGTRFVVRLPACPEAPEEGGTEA